MKKNDFYEVVWLQNMTLQVYILNTEIQEYVVVHLGVAEFAHKRRW
jgi:hypothetical protein